MCSIRVQVCKCWIQNEFMLPVCLGWVWPSDGPVMAQWRQTELWASRASMGLLCMTGCVYSGDAPWPWPHSTHRDASTVSLFVLSEPTRALRIVLSKVNSLACLGIHSRILYPFKSLESLRNVFHEHSYFHQSSKQTGKLIENISKTSTSLEIIPLWITEQLQFCAWDPDCVEHQSLLLQFQYSIQYYFYNAKTIKLVLNRAWGLTPWSKHKGDRGKEKLPVHRKKPWAEPPRVRIRMLAHMWNMFMMHTYDGIYMIHTKWIVDRIGREYYCSTA